MCVRSPEDEKLLFAAEREALEEAKLRTDTLSTLSVPPMEEFYVLSADLLNSLRALIDRFYIYRWV